MFMLKICAFITCYHYFHNTFLQEIYELGTSEQDEMHVENGGQGSTSEQSAMETSNGETDNTKVSKI